MTTREPLPHRRASTTIETKWQEVVYAVSFGTFDDGRVSEVFIDCTKSASQASAVGRDAAILLSLALQHGVALQTLQHGITRNAAGQPLSIAGHAIDLVASREAQP